MLNPSHDLMISIRVHRVRCLHEFFMAIAYNILDILAHWALHLTYIGMIHLALINASVFQATPLIVTMADWIIHHAIRKSLYKS